MVWLPNGEKILKVRFIHFDKNHECDRLTDRQTPHDNIDCTCIASRGNNIIQAGKQVMLKGKCYYIVPLVWYLTLKVLRYGSQFYLQITPYLPLNHKCSPDGAFPD